MCKHLHRICDGEIRHHRRRRGSSLFAASKQRETFLCARCQRGIFKIKTAHKQSTRRVFPVSAEWVRIYFCLLSAGGTLFRLTSAGRTRDSHSEGDHSPGRKFARIDGRLFCHKIRTANTQTYSRSWEQENDAREMVNVAFGKNRGYLG